MESDSVGGLNASRFPVNYQTHNGVFIARTDEFRGPARSIARFFCVGAPVFIFFPFVSGPFLFGGCFAYVGGALRSRVVCPRWTRFGPA